MGGRATRPDRSAVPGSAARTHVLPSGVARPLRSARSLIMRAAQEGISTVTSDDHAEDRAVLAYQTDGRRPELRRASRRARRQESVERPVDPAELDPYDC
jgi:hypothetical protein